MSDYVLSVWGRDDPEGEPHPIRLRQIGCNGLLATHSEGFDLADLIHNEVAVDPESVYNKDNLRDESLQVAVGEILWNRLTPGEICSVLKGVLRQSRIYVDLRGSAQLSRLPWELLRCDGQFVFAVQWCSWSLGRPERRRGPAAGDPVPLDHPLRVMVVIGNEPGDTRLQADAEME